MQANVWFRRIGEPIPQPPVLDALQSQTETNFIIGHNIMLRSTIKTAMAASSLIIAPVVASASVSFLSYGTSTPTGENLITDFSSSANLSGGTLFTGTTIDSAAPAYSATTFDTAQYLDVAGGQSATLTFAPSKEISVYLGSLDPYNTLSFGGPGGATFTGADLGAVSGANNGDQQSALTNGRFIFTFANAVNSATFQSGSNAFEVASVAGIASPTGPGGPGGVPEPASWALMLVGFSGMGAALRGSRRRAAVAA